MTPASQDSTAPATGKGLNIREIMRFLPHRFPFLMVDRITSFEQYKYVEGYKCVSFNEPFFQGHFPDMPVMPGVLIVEAMAQAGGFLIYNSEDQDIFKHAVFLFTGIENVRFRRPVVPGDRLDLRCDLIRTKMRLWKMRATAHVDGSLAAGAELTAAVVLREEFK